MIRKITSTKNPVIKDTVNLLTKSRERKKRNLTVIEGIKEINIALKSGVIVEKVFFCSDIVSESQVISFYPQFGEVSDFFDCSPEVFSKISYRESTGGIVLVVKTKDLSLSDFKIKENCLFVVLESVEKPGNLGAICRIADGAKIDGIIICDPLTDIYNPNSIRASLGCVFSTNVVSCDYESLVNWINQNKITTYAAELRASKIYHNVKFAAKTAIVFGTEAHGLTEKWIETADQNVKIPMLGQIDSLNVSTSVAVIVYEVKRQRDFLV